MNVFAKRIKSMRIEKGLSQAELGDALGVSTSTIGMWETGKRLPSTELYEAVADFFNVDIDFLYGRTDIERKEFVNEIDGTVVREISVNEIFFGDRKDHIEFAKNGGRIVLNEENNKRFLKIQNMLSEYDNMSPEDQDIVLRLITLYMESKKQ